MVTYKIEHDNDHKVVQLVLTSLAEVGHGWREHALDGNVLLFGPLDKWRIRRTL